MTTEDQDIIDRIANAAEGNATITSAAVEDAISLLEDYEAGPDGGDSETLAMLAKLRDLDTRCASFPGWADGTAVLSTTGAPGMVAVWYGSVLYWIKR